MADRKWTAEQQAAIDTRDRTLLVSAAAGSGKTATLTERIIRSLLDEKNPVDISDMLIVTFTNAAVDELRDRIGKAVGAAVAKDPSNMRLNKQLLSMKDAKIMTIDSFCNRVVKLSPSSVGLAPNYRIGEGAEMALLRSDLIEGMIFSAYEGELEGVCTGAEFADLAECLTDTRGERGLGEVFRMLYEQSESSDAGVSLYGALAEDFNPEGFTSPEETKFGRYIIEKTKALAQSYLELYRKRFEFECGSPMEQRGFPLFDADAVMLRALLSAKSYTELRDIIRGHSFPSLPGGRGERGAAYCELKEIRAMLRAELSGIAEKYYSYTADMWEPLFSELYSKLSLLYRFLRRFDELYTKEKKKRGVCTYADLERYAVELLYKGDAPSDLALEIAASYKQIYIDEYQDVNKLQGMIFDAVAKDDNRFMVGDIKQSIYGFRGARPQIFAKMKTSYPPLGAEGSFPAASLFMSSNFRCDEPIIDFANGIFDKMLGAFADTVGYTENDRLRFAKIYADVESPSGHIPEINVVAKGASSAFIDEDADPDENLEAALVAKKIKELLSGEVKNDGAPILPKDIAIIMRSDAGKAKKYADAIGRLGIKASVPDSKDFFLNEEILLTLSLLHSVDNPRKDIYLSSLMCSPLFGFSADELLIIRRSSKRESLWEALGEYIEAHPDYEKGAKFVQTLAKYRRMAEGVSVDKLLSVLYRETGLMALAAGSGGRDNLILLHNYARQYEESSFKGLYSFISYVNQIIESGERAQFAEIEGAADSVRIITAHKSKGLEFPVCFLVGAGARIAKVNKTRISLNTDFGFGILLKDESRLATVENPVFHAINGYTAEEEFEEELRVLYVALTRARERLFIYGSILGAKCDKALAAAELKGQNFSPFMARKCKSFLEIILATHTTGRVVTHEPELAAGDAPIAENASEESERVADEVEIAPDKSAENIGAEGEVAEAASPATAKEAEGELSAELSAARESLRERFSFEYPYRYEGLIPEKLSVSKLYPEVLDESAEDFSERLTIEGEQALNFRPTIPEFISGHAADESAKRGIATHMFMQFCDLEKLEKYGAEEELRRLVRLEFLSKKDGERVRLGEIEDFTRSPLFREMREARRLYRELRFNLRLPAEEFTENPEAKAALRGKTLLTQGVIDCIIEGEDGSLHLIDYKTDRLTKEELENPRLGEKRLRATHERQLSYYKRAILEMFGKEPRRAGVYSLHLGVEIDV